MSQGNHKLSEHRHIDSIFRYAEILGFGEIHIKIDHATGLHAIIAIHNTQLGPAIGGCRLIHYDHTDYALVDAMRLAQMMSYKAAICDLPHGGAKAVIMKPKTMKDRTAFFKVFGEFVQEQQGKYITAVDSGTDPNDMDTIASQTSYVTCTTFGGYAGDPSPQTALGVRRGIEAAVKFKLGKDNLKGVHIAIQGAGHVAFALCRELIAGGAKITLTDINANALQRIVEEFGTDVIRTVPPDKIYEVPCDVFAPCALGAVLNFANIHKLKAVIVAGSANNQLANHHFDALLFQRDILYVPDFIINSGGLIHVANIYDHGDAEKANAQIYNLYDKLLHLFERAHQERRPTNEIAEVIALEKIQASKKTWTQQSHFSTPNDQLAMGD